MTQQGIAKIGPLPAWVAATWISRDLCQCCGATAFGIWAGTGELLCESHTAAAQAAADDRFRD